MNLREEHNDLTKHIFSTTPISDSRPNRQSTNFDTAIIRLRGCAEGVMTSATFSSNFT